jgi:hypothetical protein
MANESATANKFFILPPAEWSTALPFTIVSETDEALRLSKNGFDAGVLFRDCYSVLMTS